MNNKIKLSMVAGAFLVSSSLFVGCGSDSSSVATSLSTATTIGGNAVDGYLKSSTITYTIHNDDNSTSSVAVASSALDAGKGAFTNTFYNDENVTKITAKGGTDIGTNLSFGNRMISALVNGATTVNITPLTSLLAEAYDHNASRYGNSEANATTTIAKALGITEAQLLSDIITDGNGTVTQKALTIVNTLNVLDANGTEALNVLGNLGIILTKALSDNNSSSDQNITAAVNDLDSNSSTVLGRILARDISGPKNNAVKLAALISSMSPSDFTPANLKKNSSAVSFAADKAKKGEDIPNLAELKKVAAIIERFIELETKVNELAKDDSTIDVADFKFDLAGLLDKNISEISEINTSVGNIETAAQTIIDAQNNSDENATRIRDIFKSDAVIKTNLEKENLLIQIPVDNISLKDGKITIGDVTKTVSGGSFGTINHDTIVGDGNISTLSNISFSITDETIKALGIEDGKTVSVKLGAFIKDNDTARRLFIVLSEMKISRSGTAQTDENILNQTWSGEFSSTVNAGAVVTGYAVKADGTPVQSSLTNGSVNNSAATTEGAISYNFSNAIKSFEQSDPSLAKLTALLGVKGKYDLRFFISGVDGVNVAKAATNIATDMPVGYKSAIESAFPEGKTFEISGSVTIGYDAASLIAEDKSSLHIASPADINSTSVASISLPTTGANGSTITWSSNSAAISSNGTVTGTASDQSVTITAHLSLTTDTTTVTETKSFNFTVLANEYLAAVATTKSTADGLYSSGPLTINSSGYAELTLSSSNGVTTAWTRKIDNGNESTVTGTNSILSKTSAQSVVYKATFTKGTATDSSTYTYTIPADNNRAVSGNDSNLTASATGDLTVDGTRAFTANIVDGYGEPMSETVNFTATGGSLSSTSATATTFTGSTAGSASVTATVGSTEIGQVNFEVVVDQTINFDTTVTDSPISGVTLNSRDSGSTKVEFQTTTYNSQTPANEMYVTVGSGVALVNFPGEFVGRSFSITSGGTEYIGTFVSSTLNAPTTVSAI